MDDDAQLLARYANEGCEEAFTEVVRRYLNLVYSAALRQVGGNSHRAEEVAQTVFSDLARKAASVSRHSALIGWLYTSTHFAARNLARSERRRRNYEEKAQAMHDILRTTEPDADWERLRPIIDDAMQELNTRDRAAVLLRFFEQRSFAEVGAKLGVSENAARKTTERAIEKVRRLIARRGITSTTGALATVMAEQAVMAAPAGMVTSVTTAALESIAVSGGSVTSAGIIHLMSTAKSVVSVASIVCAVAVGSAIYQASRAREAEASLATLTSAEKISAARTHDLQTKRVTMGQAGDVAVGTDPANKSADVADLDQGPGAMQKRRKGSAQVQSAALFSELMQDPTYAAVWRKQQLRTVLKQYGDDLDALHLPPEKLAKLKELMVLEREIEEDAKDAGRSAGLTGENLQKAVRQARTVVHEEIKALLGETEFAQLARSALAKPTKPMIEDTFGVDLKVSGLPLSSEQVTSLALGFREVIQAFEPKEKLADPPDPQTGLTPVQQALLKRYAQDLSPAQVQIAREYFVEQAKWGQLNKKRGVLR